MRPPISSSPMYSRTLERCEPNWLNSVTGGRTSRTRRNDRREWTHLRSYATSPIHLLELHEEQTLVDIHIHSSWSSGFTADIIRSHGTPTSERLGAHTISVLSHWKMNNNPSKWLRTAITSEVFKSHPVLSCSLGCEIWPIDHALHARKQHRACFTQLLKLNS